MFPCRGDRQDALSAPPHRKSDAGVIKYDYAGVFYLKAVAGW